MSLRQASITQWTNKESKFVCAYPYFYLEWDLNNDFPTNQATWYQSIPANKIVRWRKIIRVGYRDVCICCSYLPPEIPICGMFSGSMYDSFLKSHLQKAIRRKNARAAIYTADILMEMSLVQLLRRLPIIMIEDSFPHEGYTTLIWMMCAVSSGFNLGQLSFSLHEKQRRWILGLVYQFAMTDLKEISPDNCYIKKFDFKRNLRRMGDLPRHIRDFVYSIETRKVYGGMKGDESMMSAFQNHYTERFIGENKGLDKDNLWENIFFSPIRPILCKQTSYDKNSWIYAGYDFHCSPSILSKLEEKYPDIEKDDFKMCIWVCSSSRNYRRSVRYEKNVYKIVVNDPTPRYLSDLWKKIRKFVRGKAWGYVNHMLDDLNMTYPDWIQYTPPRDNRFLDTSIRDTQDQKEEKKYDCDEEESKYIVS